MEALFTTVASAFLMLSPAASTNGLQQTTTVDVSAGKLRFTGQITPEAVNRFEALVRTAPARDLKTLRIESTGGDTSASIRLGTLIRAQSINVEVARVCATSCALYVLPAASTVRFEPGALLVLAQAPSPQLRAAMIEPRLRDPGQREKAEAEDKIMRKVLLEQDTYFRSLGLDPGRVYSSMDVWLHVMQQLRMRSTETRAVGIVPDGNFLNRCMGFSQVRWASPSVEDSRKLAHQGATPLVVMVDGKIYYEGSPVSSKIFSCS